MSKKPQHAIGVARAILFFTEKGMPTFAPVSDISRYDIVVDTEEGLMRVEVKTTSSKDGEVTLRTCGGNQSWNGVVKKISSDDCDIVFAMNVTTGGFEVFDADYLEGRSTVRVK